MINKYLRTASLLAAALALPAAEPASVILLGRSASAVASGSRRWVLAENGLASQVVQAGETFRLPANRGLMITAVGFIFRGGVTAHSRGATFEVASRTVGGTNQLAIFSDRVPANLGTSAVWKSFPAPLPVPAGAEILAAPLEVRPENGLAAVDVMIYGTYAPTK